MGSAPAKEHEVDIIVIATGFDALTGPLKNLGIRGRGGQSLAQKWEDGPETYLGLAMAGFPNLFTSSGFRWSASFAIAPLRLADVFSGPRVGNANQCAERVGANLSPPRCGRLPVMLKTFTSVY
jgi:hypothetical protein